MATKTNFLNTINGFITAIVNIVKVRSSFSTVADELYPTIVTDNQTSETYTSKVSTQIDYSLIMRKSGSAVDIKLSILQDFTLGALPSQTLFTWKNNDYKPSVDTGDVIFKIYNLTTDIIIKINSTGCYLLSNIPSGGYQSDFKTYLTE